MKYWFLGNYKNIFEQKFIFWGWARWDCWVNSFPTAYFTTKILLSYGKKFSS